MQTLNSMTGFGRVDQVTDAYRIVVELKSVNHRFLDLSIRMPRRFNCFESRIRQVLKEYLDRGKTDLFVTYEAYAGESSGVHYNEKLAAAYMACFDRMAEAFPIRNDIGVSELARCPEVLIVEEDTSDDDSLWAILEPALRKAAEQFREARAAEGARLCADLETKLTRMASLVADIEAASPSVVETYRSRLYAKIRETLADAAVVCDEGRIAAEVAIYADKVCTDEEMVRLKSHIEAMRTRLGQGGACGRELDFLAQEMNREANTTLSKAGSLQIADKAILLKTEIEKIREQVQNIE